MAVGVEGQDQQEIHSWIRVVKNLRSREEVVIVAMVAVGSDEPMHRNGQVDKGRRSQDGNEDENLALVERLPPARNSSSSLSLEEMAVVQQTASENMGTDMRLGKEGNTLDNKDRQIWRQPPQPPRRRSEFRIQGSFVDFALCEIGVCGYGCA